jgi:parallel beta-helix repeat protein
MRKNIVLLLVLVLLVWSIVVIPLPVQAQVRTIVVPDDYATINAAIESASDGDTILVRNGTYHENVRVTKAIMLVGEDNQETRIDGNAKEGYWVPLALRHDNAVVSNLNLCNSYAGIQLGKNNCTVLGNRIIANGFGVEIGWNSSGNTIIGNIIASNDRGIEIRGGTSNLVQGNEILSNSIGIYLNDEQSNDNNITGNMIDNSRDAGIRLRMSWDNTFSNNTVMNTGENAIAVGFANNNTFRHNNFVNNTNQYYDGGENVPPEMAPYYVGYTSENVFEENYWSDYQGGDYDGDGKGNSAYAVWKKNADGSPLMNPVAFPERAVPPEYEPPDFPPLESASELPMTEVFLVVSIVAVVLVIAGLLFYFKKRKR